MAFMKPEYFQGKYTAVDNSYSETTFLPDFVVWSKRKKDYADYIETGEVQSIEHCEGVLTRLSAAGYMDCSDWIPFDTIEEARKHWENEENIDTDSGDSLDEEE